MDNTILQRTCVECWPSKSKAEELQFFSYASEYTQKQNNNNNNNNNKALKSQTSWGRLELKPAEAIKVQARE